MALSDIVYETLVTAENRLSGFQWTKNLLCERQCKNMKISNLKTILEIHMNDKEFLK